MRFFPVFFSGNLGSGKSGLRIFRIASLAALAAVWLCTGCAAHKKSVVAAHKPQATAPTLPPDHPTFSGGASADQGAPAVVSPTSPALQDQALIDASKAAYDNGVQQYRAGQFSAARSDFDHAVDLYLTSGRDLQTDAPLQAAFERMVDAVNGLEMAALQQGTGFGQQEAAPVDVANDVTFPVDPNLEAQAQAELKRTQSDLPLVVNDYVASFINYFSNTNSGHNTIKHALERASRYKTMIMNVLQEEGVPQDLIYLAVAESGFQPRAVNRRSGAGGMWQFMPFAASYGLERNRWVDERFDPIQSTRAYARYIKALHAQFGDWYLAMAAYDWGPGPVQRSVQRTGYADFWELYRRNVLPAETKNYVPIILAATIMAKNPAQYGLSDMTPDPPLVMDTVTVHSSTDLRLAADLVGSTAEELESLNPSLLHMRTPVGESFDLHLPVGTKELFEQRVILIPEDHRDSWRYVTTTSGETLNDLAVRFHIKAAEIATVNHLSLHAALESGTALVIPQPPAPMPTSARMRYRVRRGDTVVTVADRFGVTAAEVRRWNHLAGNHLAPGRTLYVSQPTFVARRRRSRRSQRSRRASAHTSSRAKTKAASSSSTRRKHHTGATRTKTN